MHWIYDLLTAEDRRDAPFVTTLAVDGADARWSYGQVAAMVAELHRALPELPADSRVGLIAKNSVHWVAADLALLGTDLVEVPVPIGFSAEQAGHLLSTCRCILVDAAGLECLRQWDLPRRLPLILIDDVLSADSVGSGAPTPQCTATTDDRVIKVIHTSGTTGTPKGVQISGAGMRDLLDSLQAVTADVSHERYLSTVPLSLLVEQILAIYFTLARGTTLVFLPPEQPELGGPGSDPGFVLHTALSGAGDAAFLPPALVDLLAHVVESSPAAASAAGQMLLLTGGAPVSPDTLLALKRHDVHVYEGYGLSENSSVVAWNSPAGSKIGTVGKPLRHCAVRLDPDGELLVKSTSLLAGYEALDPTSLPIDADGWLHTGDIASIDDDGYLTIRGRKRNMIITSMGRNVSPEFVESALRRVPTVADSVVFGDGLPHLVAMIVHDAQAAPPTSADLDEFATSHLPYTDRPDRYVFVADSPELRATFFTLTGRPRRNDIWTAFVAPQLVDKA